MLWRENLIIGRALRGEVAYISEILDKHLSN